MSLASVQAGNTRRQKAMEANHPGTVTIGGTTYAGAVQIGGIEQKQSANGSGFTPVGAPEVPAKFVSVGAAQGDRLRLVHLPVSSRHAWAGEGSAAGCGLIGK